MKNIVLYTTCLGAAIGIIGFGVTARAASLPDDVSVTLQQREQHLTQLTFEWKLTSEEKHTGFPAAQVKTMREATRKGLEDQYRKWGQTDEKAIERNVNASMQSFTKAVEGGSATYSNTWHFQRDGEATLVTGTTQSYNGFVNQYRQLYDGDAAMTICDDSTSPDGGKLSVVDPSVWGSPGKSVRYFDPVSQGLGLLPEHFAVLTGFNPLEMHGATWTLVSTTEESWQLEAHFVEQNAPTTVRMTLSRAQKGMPTFVQVHQGDDTETFQVQNYEQRQGDWIAQKVEYSKLVPGVTEIHQEWELQGVTASQPIELKMNNPKLVHDYRLLGGSLTTISINQAEMRRGNDKVVHYPWNGHIPSKTELEQIQSKEYPGEATPDPGKSSSLPFVGGLMALVGGVWMFRRRGSAA